MALPRRAVPAACLLPIAVGTVLRQPLQFVLCLPLLPSRGILANYEKVRGVANYLASAVSAVVIQRNCIGLIVKLQCLEVVLHLIDGREFYAMTFKLDGHPHL